MRPSDYLWENVATPRSLVVMKTCISNTLALVVLTIGFTCIIAAKGAETSAQLRLGQTDCTLYEFAYSGAFSHHVIFAFSTIVFFACIAACLLPHFSNASSSFQQYQTTRLKPHAQR
jgi:hypothetical protein